LRTKIEPRQPQECGEPEKMRSNQYKNRFEIFAEDEPKKNCLQPVQPTKTLNPNSLAAKLKASIQLEEQQKLAKRYRGAKKPEETPIIFPLTAMLHATARAKKRQHQARVKEVELEEENYQWQVNPEMFPEAEEDFRIPPADDEYVEEQEEGLAEPYEEE
jgi:hypothetical protein